MKIINISGGLGNQMFQYAFALSLKKHFPEEEVLIDTSHYHTLFFKKYKGINLHNGFEIDAVFPNADLPVAKWWQLLRVSYYIPNYVLSRLGRKFLPQRKSEMIPPYSETYSYDPSVYQRGNRYYEGFWQSADYFADAKVEIARVFAHPEPNEYNRRMIEEIKAAGSVGIHVRRGDYLNEPAYRDICDENYYMKAIREILSDQKTHTFYVFSNDKQWCVEHLAPLVKESRIVFLDGNKGKDSCWDMFLMTYCHDLIIANSSFSWWGAFLNNRNGRVIAPDPWVNREGAKDIYCPHWIRIS